MDSHNYFKQPTLFGIIAIASPVLAIILLLFTTSLFLAIIPIVIDIVVGIKGFRSGDRKARTFSMIGLILIALELVIGIPLIFLTFTNGPFS